VASKIWQDGLITGSKFTLLLFRGQAGQREAVKGFRIKDLQFILDAARKRIH